MTGDKFFDRMVKLRDVTPLSLGTSIIGGRFSCVIKKNTPIPCKNTETYYTVYDNQTKVSSKIYQGERPLVKDNHYLNKDYEIEVPPMPAGEATIDTTFEIDESGLLTVTCVEPTSGRQVQLRITPQEAHLGEADIQAMIQKANSYRREDQDALRDVEEQLRRQRLFSAPHLRMPAARHERDVVLGVDLGTTNSVVAVVQDGDAEVLVNDVGNRLTPSCVHVPGSGRQVGEAALRMAVSDPEHTVILDQHGKSVQDARSLELLRAHWEKAKQKLSRIPTTKISTFLPDVDLEFQYEASRGDLEKCRPLFERIVGALLEVLDAAEVQKEAVDDILLVGGSTRVHRVRELVQEALSDTRLCKAVHQDEDVAKGAALLGAGCFQVKDVTALHINVMHNGEEITIAANTQLPYKNCKTSAKDAAVMVRQGHWVNRGAEEMPLTAIIEAPRRARISFAGIQVDESGLFEFLDARGRPLEVVPRGCLSRQKLAELRDRNREREREQEGEKSMMEAKNALEAKCRTLIALQVADDDPDAEFIGQVKRACQERLDWLQGNSDATREEVDYELELVTKGEVCLSDTRKARALDALEREGERRRAEEEEALRVRARTALAETCRAVAAKQVPDDDQDAAAFAHLQERCGHELIWLQNNPEGALEELDRKRAEIDQEWSDLLQKGEDRARRRHEARPRTASSVSQPRDARQAKGIGAGTSSVSSRDVCQGDGEPASTNVSMEAAGAAERERTDHQQAQILLKETYKHVFTVEGLRRKSFTPPLSPDSAKGPTSRWLQEHPDETLRALGQDVAQEALLEARRAGAAVLLVDAVQGCVALSVRYLRGEAARAPVERLLALRDAFTTTGGDLLRHLDELSAGEDPAALTRVLLGVSWEDDLGPVSAAAGELLARLQVRASAEQHADGRRPAPVRLWVGGHSLEMRLANECAGQHPEARSFFEHVHTVMELFFGPGGGFGLLRRHCPTVRREDGASVRGLVQMLALPGAGGAEGVTKALVDLRAQSRHRRTRAAVDELLGVMQDPIFLACACIFDQLFSSFRSVGRVLVLETTEYSNPAVLEHLSADLKAQAREDAKLRFESRREFSKLATRLSETARTAVDQCIRETAPATWVQHVVAFGGDADHPLLQSVPREVRLSVLDDLRRARELGLAATDPWALLQALPPARFRADFPDLDKALVALLTAPLLPCRGPGGAEARSVDLLRKGMLAASDCPDVVLEPVILLLSSTDWSGVYDREKDFCPLLKALVPIVQQ
ncbi:hypothetical protein FOCC_FOCC012312 [Frankliniella occidentalis]|nr:hypothetical protein FOCC_FOCC012312 [Frankliniella occidentalis]